MKRFIIFLLLHIPVIMSVQAGKSYSLGTIPTGIISEYELRDHVIKQGEDPTVFVYLTLLEKTKIKFHMAGNIKFIMRTSLPMGSTNYNQFELEVTLDPGIYQIYVVSANEQLLNSFYGKLTCTPESYKPPTPPPPPDYAALANEFPEVAGNYIISSSPQKEMKDVTLNPDNEIITVQYLDGLGRLTQTVMKGVTPLKKDLVSLHGYDYFGRQSEQWLPAVIQGNNGAYVIPTTVMSNAKSLNADQIPYSRPKYEASPLNKILEQASPGKDWYDNNRSQKIECLTNSGISGDLSCIRFRAVISGASTVLAKDVYYDNNQLYVTKLLDEENQIAYEFKDKQGQIILIRQISKVDGIDKTHDTYHVYDDFGNLSYVLPPILTDLLLSGKSLGDEGMEMKQFAYLYKYDNANRCSAKRLPGCDWIHYVYDKADRIILSQDGEERKKTPAQWTFTIPDVFGRIVLSGICTNSIANINALNNVVTTATYTGVGETYKGYTITNFTPTTGTLLTVNYYDNYTYLTKHGFVNTGYNTQSGFAAMHSTPKGQLTGSATALMDGSGKFLYTSMYYDSRARLIQTKMLNHIDADEREYIAYNFTGQPIKKYHRHEAKGKPVQEETYTYTYDHAGRLLTTTHQLNGGTVVTLASNTYDELGRLNKNVKNNQANLTTGYTYNVRSWTKSISSPLFKQTLYYNESYGGSLKQYNGNISAMDWTLSGDKTRGYAFTYDNLSRLTAANYLENESVPVNSTNPSQAPSYKTAYSYDKHGNIKTLQRYGKTTTGSTFGLIDNLTISHTGNQLLKVDETIATITMSESTDFKNYTNTAAEYQYNANGAMTQDLNKGISAIQYNSLNLPQVMDIKSPVAEARNEYTYTAAGAKLKVVQKWNPNYSTAPVIGSAINTTLLTSTKTTDYVGNIIYENGALKRTLIDGGYIEAGVYHFYLTDHLGNNRIVANASGAVIQRNHYYPFGMAFAEMPITEQGKQPYKYNGKESDQMHGLNLYDYSARYMDAALPGFITMDPLAEKYYSISPYVYVGNNPIIRTDPTGMDWFYHSVDGKSDPSWNWHDGDKYDTGVKDSNGKNVVLSGAKAVVVFNGSRSEKLGKGDNIKGEGAVTASVTVYGPDGADDIHSYKGYTMTSDSQKYGPIDEGMYNANYDTKGKSGTLKSNWVLNNRGAVRMLDGEINPNAPNQISSNGEGFKDGIFIHSTNKNGFAGGTVSTGCLLIHPNDWVGFNNVMSGVKNFKVQVIRQVLYKEPLQGVVGIVPGLYVPRLNLKKY